MTDKTFTEEFGELGAVAQSMGALLDRKRTGQTDSLVRDHWRESVALMARSVGNAGFLTEKAMSEGKQELALYFYSVQEAMVQRLAAVLAIIDFAGCGTAEEATKIVEETLDACRVEVEVFGKVLGFDPIAP